MYLLNLTFESIMAPRGDIFLLGIIEVVDIWVYQP